MDISKIQFGQLSQSKGIDKTFEDLDINSDGKINEEDTTLANDDVKSIITNILSMQDAEEDIKIIEEPLQKTSSSKKTSSSTYTSDLNNNLTWTTDDFFNSIDLSVTTWYQSGLKSDTNFKNIKNQMLSDPLLSQKLSDDDIEKIKAMISDSAYKVYAKDLQAILDAIESKQDSIQTIKDNLVDSELPNGKSITVNVNYPYTEQNGGNDDVTIQNVNGTYVYKFSGNGNSNFSLTDSQLDRIMSVINSDENFKNIFQSMLQTNVSDPGGNWNNNITEMKSTFINSRVSGSSFDGQNFMDAIASALNTTANISYDGIYGHGKYEFTNELGETSTAKFCTSCNTAPQIFLADIYKALQAREMLNSAKNTNNTNNTATSNANSVTTDTKIQENESEQADLQTNEDAIATDKTQEKTSSSKAKLTDYFVDFDKINEKHLEKLKEEYEKLLEQIKNTEDEVEKTNLEYEAQSLKNKIAILE